MTDQTAQVSVRILEKEYQVACPAEERTNLLDSAEVLNLKMREIRDKARVGGAVPMDEPQHSRVGSTQPYLCYFGIQ